MHLYYWIYKTHWRKSIRCLAKPHILSFPSTHFINSKIHYEHFPPPPPRMILIVRLFATPKLVLQYFCDRLRLSRLTVHKMVTLSFKAYAQLPGNFNCSIRRSNMVEDPCSPPHNRFCDFSQSLRLVVQDCLRLACAIGLIQVTN